MLAHANQGRAAALPCDTQTRRPFLGLPRCGIGRAGRWWPRISGPAPIMAEALLDATYANPGWMNGKTNYLVFRSRPSEGRAKPGLGLPALAERGVRTKAYQGCVPRRVPVGRCLEGGREGICLR